MSEHTPASEVSMEPKDYNKEIPVADTVVGEVYRGRRMRLMVRIGTYPNGCPQFAYGYSNDHIGDKTADDETLYAQDPAMPEGAVRRGDLQVGDLWVCDKSNVAKIGCIKRVKQTGKYFRAIFIGSGNKVVFDDSNIPDTPVWLVDVAFKLRGEPTQNVQEPYKKKNCGRCVDQVTDSDDDPCCRCKDNGNLTATPGLESLWSSEPRTNTSKDVAPKGVRFDKLEVGQWFMLTPTRFNAINPRRKLTTVKYSNYNGEVVEDLPASCITYPVTLTCKLEGTG